ncbi:MAG: PucR family transcriptional regulator [Solirubrobacteraceae bacterium]
MDDRSAETNGRIDASPAPATTLPPPAARITVAEALATPALRRGLPDVRAGHENLDRPIRWVHAGEVSYMASMLTGGEMLLTTGMGIGRRPVEQRRFVTALAERGVAALVIELGHAFTDLPDAIVQAAEQHGLPLVALSRDVPFISVTEAIHTELVNAHYVLLRRGDEVHRRLTQLLLDGHGIPEVLAATAELVGNPVYLEDGDHRLLYHAGSAGDGVDPLEAWRAAEGQGRAAWRAGIAEPVPMGSRHHPGRLLVLPVSGPLEETARVVLQRAAGIVALSLLRARQEEELLARERGDFLAELAQGRIDGAAAGRQAATIGFPERSELLLGIAGETTTTVGTAAWSLVLRDAQSELEGRGISALVGQHERPGRLLAVVAVRSAEVRPAVADRLAAALRTSITRRLGETDVRIAVSDAVPWARIGPNLRLAADSAAAAVVLPTRGWRDVGDLELQRLLWRWRDDEELAAFVQRRLGALLEHDDQRKHHLLPTLEALCAHGWHKAEAARALHLNRQALYNRLARIEELLGCDLGDPEQTLTLHLALRARPYVADR